MAAKYQLMTELYQRTGKTVTRNPQAWQGFLSSACRNYKCRFDEQLLIYAQRPDAVAVTTMPRNSLSTIISLLKLWIMEIKGVRYSYDNKRNVLKGVSAELDAGKMYTILGPSGCGKTTLLSLLGGLDSPSDGQVLFQGEDIEKKGLAFRTQNCCIC